MHLNRLLFENVQSEVIKIDSFREFGQKGTSKQTNLGNASEKKDKKGALLKKGILPAMALTI